MQRRTGTSLTTLALFISSGARSQSASVLSSLQELKDVRDNLNNKKSQLQETEQQLAGLKGVADKYEDLVDDR